MNRSFFYTPSGVKHQSLYNDARFTRTVATSNNNSSCSACSAVPKNNQHQKSTTTSYITNENNSQRVSKYDIDNARIMIERYKHTVNKNLSNVFIDRDGDVIMLINSNGNTATERQYYEPTVFKGDKDTLVAYSRISDTKLSFIIEKQSCNKVLFYAEYNANDFKEFLQTTVNGSSLNNQSNEVVNTLNLVGYITYVVLASQYKKLQTNQHQASGYGSKKVGNKLQNIQPVCCINHDLKCTPPASNQVSVSFLFCDVVVDVGDCCVQHDIDLWCGAPLPDPITMLAYLTAVNLKLGACLAGKITDKVTHGMPLYCGGIITGLLMGVIGGIILGAVYFIGTELGGLTILHSEYFPGDRRHDDCCLCGGTKPTGHCDGWESRGTPSMDCRDICKERGIKSNCTVCGWKCIYDDQGKPIRVEAIRGTEDTPCCPGTDTDLASRCLPTEVDAIKDCKGEPCDSCYFMCEYNNKGNLYWRYYGSDQLTGKPCCKPAPTIPKWPNVCTKEGQISR